MYRDYFYHSTVKRIIAAFGSLFTNITTVRSDSSGTKSIKIPIAYGPRAKWLTRIAEEPDLTDKQSEVAIRLPRMAFEITGLSVDDPSKINRANTYVVNSADGTQSGQTRPGLPYIISIQLSIMSKNQDDALQIIEQILPAFNPDHTLTIKDLYGTDQTADVPITLNSVNLQDEYEGDALTRRTLVYSLDFNLKIKFYGPLNLSVNGPRGLIRTTNVALFSDGKYQSTLSVGVKDPETDEAHSLISIDENTFFSQPVAYTLTLDSMDGSFTLGEDVFSTFTGTFGRVTSLSPFMVTSNEGLLLEDEYIIGKASKAHGRIASVTH